MKRRTFLKHSNCAALSSVGILNSLVNLKMIGNVAAQTSGDTEFKAVVCLFLSGGNDSHNMLVPTDLDEFNNYLAIRSNLALPAPGADAVPVPGSTTGAVIEALLPIDRQNSTKTAANNDRSFAVNGSCSGLQSLFNSGDLAFVANVGTLVEPTTVAEYKAGSVQIPKSLFAHNTQQQEWQTSIPQGGVTTGWLGRMADHMQSNYNTGDVSMNISLSGNNTMQVGGETMPFSISSSGSTVLEGTGSSGYDQIRVTKTKSLMEETYKNLFTNSFASSSASNFSLNEDFAQIFDSTEFNAIFPDTGLGNELKAIAKTIASNSFLGHSRQTFFVEHGGYDMHTNLLEPHAMRLDEVDGAVTAFWNAIKELGLEDKVLLFTASDFGRTLRSNGQGSDHAWGGHQFVLGGGVDGQKIYGSYPDTSELTLGAGLDVGTNGRYLPTTSTDEYYAEIAQWFGVSDTDINEIFPNLANFSGNTPLDIMTTS